MKIQREKDEKKRPQAEIEVEKKKEGGGGEGDGGGVIMEEADREEGIWMVVNDRIQRRNFDVKNATSPIMYYGK